MSADITVFRLPVNHLAQLGGARLNSGLAMVPPPKPTYAAAVVINPESGCVIELDGVASVSATCAVTVPTPQAFGQLLAIIFGDTGGVTFTLGAGFKTAAGTINPTTGKKISILFFSDGTNFYEIARGSAV